VDLSAALIIRVFGQEASAQEGRLRTLLLISSLAAFDPGSDVVVRVLGGCTWVEERLELTNLDVNCPPLSLP
jgi:hypothetical protein